MHIESGRDGETGPDVSLSRSDGPGGSGLTPKRAASDSQGGPGCTAGQRVV
jgi:hypothetical protein